VSETVSSRNYDEKVINTPKNILRKGSSVLGEIEAEVTYGQQKHKLSLVVVDGEGQSLLGRDWLHHIKVD